MSMTETNQDGDNTPPPEGDVEARARRMGWKPPGEYDNRAGKFMTAEEFIKKGEEDLPVLKARLRTVDTNYARVLGELTDVKQTFADFRKFMTNSEKRAYEKARKELMEKRDAAVAHADTDVYHATNKEIEALDREAQTAVSPPPPPPTTPSPQIDPVAQKWVEDNPWFLSDGQLNRAAKMIDNDLLATAPGMSSEERLATVKAEVMRVYPDKFRNPRRESPSSVATPSSAAGSGSRNTGKTYDDLPPDAKKACDKFVKTIKGYTREEYLKNYDWS